MSKIVPDRPDDDPLALVRKQTLARILTGPVGGSYNFPTWLQLRADHASARDAVRAEIRLDLDFEPRFVARWDLFEVATRSSSKDEYLLRPDLGRSLCDEAKEAIRSRRPTGVDLQIVLGDGLSSAALSSQGPPLVDELGAAARSAGMSVGSPFFIRHCRVGILNDLGEILAPTVVVLLIGERPGLATAQSLSAYMAFRPRADHDDSRRNLISNIHPRGVAIDQAAIRIVALATKMIDMGTSGVEVKESGLRELSDGDHPSLDAS